MGDNGQLLEEGLQLIDIIRQRIDPQHTLPSVSLQRDPDKQTPLGTLVPSDMLISHNGKQIGTATIVKDKINKTAWINGINITDDYRGKGGYGLAAYVAAIENASLDGLVFQTHGWSQTEGAKHIWDILVDKGVASVIEPFVPDGNGLFNGKCQIKSLRELKEG